jgi:hypothetical protein
MLLCALLAVVVTPATAATAAPRAAVDGLTVTVNPAVGRTRAASSPATGSLTAPAPEASPA